MMYAPFILPSTCILPAQKERIEHKLRAKQQAFAAESRDTFERILALGTSSAGADVKHLLDGPSIAAVSGYVTFLGNISLSSFLLTVLPSNRILGHSNYSVNFLRTRKIRKHLSAVAEDDALLIRETRGSRLTPSEIAEALSERGM